MGFAPPNLRSFICSHVFDKARPILLIVHEDRDWSFMCGKSDHGGAEDCHVVGVGHLVNRDPSIDECADLPQWLRSGTRSGRKALAQDSDRCRSLLTTASTRTRASGARAGNAQRWAAGGNGSLPACRKGDAPPAS